MRTERHEGIGENAVLSGMHIDVLRDFLDAPDVFRRRSALPDASPSDIVLADLERRSIAV
jgi:hypothetical protein